MSFTSPPAARPEDADRPAAAGRERPMTPLTRRALLRRAGAAGALALGGATLTGCLGGGSAASAPGSAPVSTTPSPPSPTWTFANWPDYIDGDGTGTPPSIDLFDQRTGADTIYDPSITDNAAFTAAQKPALTAGRRIPFDLVVLSDWMAGIWVELGWAEQLDTSRLPNVEANLMPQLSHRPVDPSGLHLVPWQASMVGLAWDPAAVGGDLTSMDDLLAIAKPGAVTLLPDFRDTLGMVMLSIGIDPSTAVPAEGQRAVAHLRGPVDQGYARVSDDYVSDLTEGRSIASLAWSADMPDLLAKKPDLKFAIPEHDGAMMWSDDMLVPKKALGIDHATAWMDFVYQPPVAASLAAALRYTCPVLGAKHVVENGRTDQPVVEANPRLAENTRVFPPAHTRNHLHSFNATTTAQLAQFTAAFNTLLA